MNETKYKVNDIVQFKDWDYELHIGKIVHINIIMKEIYYYIDVEDDRNYGIIESMIVKNLNNLIMYI